MFHLSFYGLSIYGIKYWVALATFFRHYFFFIGSVKLLQILRLLQKPMLYYCYWNVSCKRSKRNQKITRENCGAQTKRSIFWRYMRCSFVTLHVTECPNFSTTSQTYLAFFSLFSSTSRWNLTASFFDNIQGALNNYSLLNAGNFSLASNKLWCTLQAIFTRVICTLIFVASIDCPGLRTHITLLSNCVVQIGSVNI